MMTMKTMTTSNTSPAPNTTIPSFFHGQHTHTHTNTRSSTPPQTSSKKTDIKLFFSSRKIGNTRNWHGIPPDSNLHSGHRRPLLGNEHLARQPTFPYEPTFRALENACNDNPDQANFRTISVVTDTDTLCQLFTLISTPSKTTPFRLELSTVRNTLFIAPGQHRGRGFTKKDGGERIKNAMPAWAADTLRFVGAAGPKLPYSGGHYRVVRYRMGDVVCAVRGRVDFVYENRSMPTQPTGDEKEDHEEEDPLQGVRPEIIQGGGAGAGSEDGVDGADTVDIQTWRTTVQQLGLGTKPDTAGMASVRFPSDSAQENMEAMLPALWFGRVPFLVDTVVSPQLDIQEANLIYVGGRYKTWEQTHQGSLQLLSGLLKKLKQVTRALGGNCILVCDPVQQCFMVMKPVIKKWPLPEELAAKFWGPDDDPAETEYASTIVSESSALTPIASCTPSGCTDWKFEEEEYRAAIQRRQPRRDVDSHKIVAEWLGRNNNQRYDSDSEDGSDSVSVRDTDFEEDDSGLEQGFIFHMDGVMEMDVDGEEEYEETDECQSDIKGEGESFGESASDWTEGQSSSSEFHDPQSTDSLDTSDTAGDVGMMNVD